MSKDDQFRSLYQKYYRRIVRFFMVAFRLSEADAEELTQDTFQRFYEALDEYRGDAAWAYLETIARNVAYNRFRAGKTQKRDGIHLDVDDPKTKLPPIPAPDHAEAQEKAMHRRLLYAEIAQLSAGQRQSLEYWLEGWSYREIATLFRISEDAVKSRIRDAKSRLRQKLGASALPEDDES